VSTGRKSKKRKPFKHTDMKKIFTKILLFIVEVSLIVSGIISWFLMAFAIEGGQSLYAWRLFLLSLCIFFSYIYLVNKEDDYV
jgi:uncharacterized membrane protein